MFCCIRPGTRSTTADGSAGMSSNCVFADRDEVLTALITQSGLYDLNTSFVGGNNNDVVHAEQSDAVPKAVLFAAMALRVEVQSCIEFVRAICYCSKAGRLARAGRGQSRRSKRRNSRRALAGASCCIRGTDESRCRRPLAWCGSAYSRNVGRSVRSSG
jgi:hypothetical protein